MSSTRFSPHGGVAFLLALVLFSCAEHLAPPVPPPDFDKPPAPPEKKEGPSPSTPPDGPAPGSPLACLGTQAPVTITSGMPYAKVRVGLAPSFEGSYLLDFGTTGSTIDLSKFPSPGPVATQCDPTKLGQVCSFADFDFFGPWGPVTLRTSQHGGPQAGILGTDFMSLAAITIDYGKSVVRHAKQKDFCSEDAMAAAGFSSLSTTGFFTNDFKKLRPLSDVIAGSTPGYTVANVPTVPLRIAGVPTFAQLDTGFDDALVPYSINVNEAFLAEVTTKSPNALVRAASKDLFLTTCAGVSEPVEAYTLAPGGAAELMNERGQVARSFPSAVLFVKRTPPEAKKCGGIGTWTVPAAQVAASFYVALDVVVFDPFGSRVWVK